MATPKETLWALEEHTKAKHEILRRYLGAWFPILNKYHQRVCYIDGFSGPGKYLGGEPGSPIIALNVAANHRAALGQKLEFLFIDKEQDRIDHLKSEISALHADVPFAITVQCNEFHKTLGDFLDLLDKTGGTPPPIFAFVDPFGFSGIPFSLIARLLKLNRSEVFLTFMVDAMQRFLEHPDETIRAHMVSLFGTEKVLKVPNIGGNRVENLRLLYQSQLRTIANFVRYFEMRDSRDRVQYYLFFASNHHLGHLKMKEAMWHLDPAGEYRFSDATDPNQLVLLELDPTEEIRKALHMKFAGSSKMSVGAIRQFVEDETAFLSPHMRAALKQMEIDSSVRCYPLKSDGKKRRTATFPDEVLLDLR